MCPTILTPSKRQKKKYNKSPKKLPILSPRGYDTHSNTIHQIYLIFFFLWLKRFYSLRTHERVV